MNLYPLFLFGFRFWQGIKLLLTQFWIFFTVQGSQASSSEDLRAHAVANKAELSIMKAEASQITSILYLWNNAFIAALITD